ncbi:High affinity copper uptake protein 1 [Eumeta japonica]|uniref:Copper transport protein n=1 Tax=Eumeta variegata TaxID=151549 RepID=A0A4C1X5H6_EUMVA|nr:High affinity copper uptake protein 1 [Eumeta japonica]
MFEPTRHDHKEENRNMQGLRPRPRRPAPGARRRRALLTSEWGDVSLQFHAGVCQEILFPGWNTRNAWQVACSALVFLVAGVLYEGLKYYREALHRAAAPAPARSTDSHLNIAKNECGPSAPCAQTAVIRYSMWSQEHVIQTLLHILQATASYLLMLVFMTYNVWLCAGLVLGLGLGYFLFGWKKHTVVDVAEHCQ